MSVCVNLTQAMVIWEEGTSTEEISPSDWPRGILLINDWCGKVQPTVGGTNPEHVGLGSTMQQAE